MDISLGTKHLRFISNSHCIRNKDYPYTAEGVEKQRKGLWRQNSLD